MAQGEGDQRRIKGERTREVIVSSALELMLGQGRDRLSARNLAAHAGISKATLFHHFQSMNEIVVAALERLFSKYIEIAAFQSDAKGPKLAAEMAREELAHAEMYQNLFRGVFSFLDEIMAHPDLKARLRKAFTSVVSVMEDSVEEAHPGVLSSAERSGIGLALTILLDSLILYVMVLEDKDALANMWHQVERVMSFFLEQKSKQEAEA